MMIACQKQTFLQPNSSSLLFPHQPDMVINDKDDVDIINENSIIIIIIIKTSGVMNRHIAFTSPLSERPKIRSVTEYSKYFQIEYLFQFQWLSVVLQRGNAVSFLATFANSEITVTLQSYT